MSQPPPTEFALDVPLSTLLQEIYSLSDELVTNAPRVLLLYGDRVQINWQKAASVLVEGEEPVPLTSGAEATVIDLQFSARPSKPATISITQRPPY